MRNIDAWSTKKEKNESIAIQKENIYICTAQNDNINASFAQKEKENFNPQSAQNAQQIENIIVNSAQKEIIIKCSVEEMMKAFFQDYTIVWHDPNVKSQENQQYIAKLRQFCKVLAFTEWKKAAIYVKEAKTVCHVITSGKHGDLLAQEISSCQSVIKIYVFCKNKAYHSIWTEHFPKVSCIETNIGAVLHQIQENLLGWYQKASSLKLSLPAFAPIFNDSDKSEMNNLHRYLKIIPNFKNRGQAKEDFINLSKKIYSDEESAPLIKKFQNNYDEYNKEQILRWYTQDSFLYRVVNNCLRIATSDSVQYCRLLLKDIEQAIKDQYQAKSKNFNGLLYRGAYLSQEEWSSLKANRDKEIEMHGFLSVSKEKNVALKFIKANPSKKVFITIIVPKGPSEEEQGFAEIEEFSDFSIEKEVLFNVRTRFTVLETEDNYAVSNCRHLVLLYGAQGFRQLIAEKNPNHDVSIPGIENVSCTHCKMKIVEISDKALFVSLADPEKQAYYCKVCLDFGVGPFLYIPTKEHFGKSYTTTINGYPLKMDPSQQTQFYGYKCCSCQAKKGKIYFICTDCDGKENKWCENCFEKDSKCRVRGHRNIILETTPFSFWCEKMSENELSHLKFQKGVVYDSVFDQARMYFESHRYGKAIEYFSLYIQENEAKGKDANLATSFNNLAVIYDNQGEYKKALEYYFRSLDIYKFLYGDNHPDTATSFNNIGMAFYNKGKYNKALEYYFKSLDIRKSAYGDNHPDTATSFNNIGQVYNAQAEHSKALEYYFRSLKIKKSVHGDNHPAIAISLNNIGMAFYDQGEYNKALEYYFKCLEVDRSVYGDNHPVIATSFNNIGQVYSAQAEHNKALEYYFRSLEIKKSIYGDNHPKIAISLNNVGMTFYDQGEYNKALEYHLKSLEIQKSVYGDTHPVIATSFNNIGQVYSAQAEHNKALEYYFRSLEIKKSIYGDNHPKIAISLNNVGMTFYDQGEYNKALEYHLKSLEIQKSVYGDTHPVIATSFNNIGLVYNSQGERSKALEYYLKCLEVKKSIHGDNHPSLETLFTNIGLVYDSLKEYTKSREYYFKSLDIKKSVYGDNHPDTIMYQKFIEVMEQHRH